MKMVLEKIMIEKERDFIQIVDIYIAIIQKTIIFLSLPAQLFTQPSNISTFVGKTLMDYFFNLYVFFHKKSANCF